MSDGDDPWQRLRIERAPKVARLTADGRDGREVANTAYRRLLESTRAIHGAGHTPVRTVRAALHHDEPLWSAGSDASVLVVDADTDARLRRALGVNENRTEISIDGVVSAVGLREAVHSVVLALLLTMQDAGPRAGVAVDGLGYGSLHAGLADLLAEHDLDRIAAAAGLGLADTGSLGVYESAGPRQAVEPLLRAAADQLQEDPLALARSLFSEAPVRGSLRRLARRIAEHLGVEPESPAGRVAVLSLLGALLAPIATAEVLGAEAHARGGNLHARVMQDLYTRAAYEEAGRWGAERFQRLVGAFTEVPQRTAPARPLATSQRAGVRAAIGRAAGHRRGTGHRRGAAQPTLPAGRAPSSLMELFAASRTAASEMLNATCKVVAVQEGFGGQVAEVVEGTYDARHGLVEVHRGVLEQLDDLIGSRRADDRSLEDRLAHCGRAAVHARAASTLLHEFLHGTDTLRPSLHLREYSAWVARWQFPVHEAITELTAHALFPEFLVRTGLARIDAVLLEVEAVGAYGAQTGAFEPVVRQVADWLGISLRDELVALKRAGGPEASMALMAEQVTGALGLDGDRRFCREVARPRIRSVVQEGMAALQDSLGGGPQHQQRGDPLAGLLAQRLRDTADSLLALHRQPAWRAATPWARRGMRRGRSAMLDAPGRPRPPEPGGSMELSVD